MFLDDADIEGGALPSSMSRLTALETLSLEGDAKTMPTGFGYFRGLHVLNLDYTKIPSISPEIWQLTQLRELEIEGCVGLESWTPDIANLQELRLLSLAYVSDIIELPQEIGSLTKLTYLSFREIRVHEFPTWIFQLHGLRTLILDLYVLNPPDKFPAAISQLTALEKLDLSHGYDEYPGFALPSAIGQLTRLTFLYLIENSFNSLPPEIGNLISLNALDLSDCKKLSQLPREIQGLKALTRLKMSCCNTIDSLPSEIGQLTALQELDLGSCKSLTSLPSTIGLLTNLSMLGLGGCSALKSLPIEVINLRKVKSLDVSAVQRLDFP